MPFVKIPYDSGFTLTELISALVVAGILVSLAVPSFTAFIKNNRLISQVNELMAELAFARSEAVKRGTNVIMCKSNDQTTCVAGAAWNDGWVIGVDQNANLALDGGELVLRVREALEGQNTLTGTGGLANQIVYTRSGMADPSLGGTGQFQLCDDRGVTHGKGLEITATGRPRVTDAPPAAC